MNHKNKKTLKKIMAIMLTLALAVTGICISDTATAKAASGIENFEDLMNTTITMKIGDTKTIEYIRTYDDGFKMDDTVCYNWATSDENIVSLVNEYAPSISGVGVNVIGFTIKAEKPGTAVISGTGKTSGKVISMTVNTEPTIAEDCAKDKIPVSGSYLLSTRQGPPFTYTSIYSGSNPCPIWTSVTPTNKSEEFTLTSSAVPATTTDSTCRLIQRCRHLPLHRL